MPTNKFDLQAVGRAERAPLDDLVPLLPDLLTWIQDMTWPVAVRLTPLLASAGEALVSHLRAVFDGEDDAWKYSCIHLLDRMEPAVQRQLMPDLQRLASSPTPGEAHEEVDLEARQLLIRLGSPAA